MPFVAVKGESYAEFELDFFGSQRCCGSLNGHVPFGGIVLKVSEC